MAEKYNITGENSIKESVRLHLGNINILFQLETHWIWSDDNVCATIEPVKIEVMLLGAPKSIQTGSRTLYWVWSKAWNNHLHGGAEVPFPPHVCLQFAGAHQHTNMPCTKKSLLCQCETMTSIPVHSTSNLFTQPIQRSRIALWRKITFLRYFLELLQAAIDMFLWQPWYK